MRILNVNKIYRSEVKKVDKKLNEISNIPALKIILNP